ncbi:HNH endonuclease signature motif containing protein [Streptomyces virginiae]|uniref:HNH endonuclease signature motif containing protein n=1 Tax=Streptomyces virginiae TaxID=1961 RepID=UPI00225AA864|nr:HNH endonuclease signature motif containing protein [Streptomyces virginiae]MCX5273746.1 HNH endonuclease [Streptomyces virginiae]
MAINVVARKMLWGRAGNQCAMTGCLQLLTVDMQSEETDVLITSGAVIGEEAHIRSSQSGGPRHDTNYGVAKLDSYENLLLLCPTHHSLVDKNNGVGYSVATLVEMKSQHERRVTAKLGPDGEEQRATLERMVATVLVWEQKADISNWESTSAQLNMPVPVLSDLRYGQISETAAWLLAKKWPKRFPGVTQGFDNLSTSLGDLLAHIRQCFEPKREGLWEFDRLYKYLSKWDPPEYKRLFRETQIRRFVLYGITAEVTKAINHAIDCVIEEVDPFYRFDSGAVLMHEGDGFLYSQVVRVEYSAKEVKGLHFYPGVGSIRARVEKMLEADVHNYDGDVMYHLNSPSKPR